VTHDGDDFFDASCVKQRDGVLDESFAADADQRFKPFHAGGKPRRQDDGAEMTRSLHEYRDEKLLPFGG
jgi:hypothetical protein